MLKPMKNVSTILWLLATLLKALSNVALRYNGGIIQVYMEPTRTVSSGLMQCDYDHNLWTCSMLKKPRRCSYMYGKSVTEAKV